jgi:membrane associated rhomboid family serine protease
MAYPQSNWPQGREFFRELPVTKMIIGIWLLVFLAEILRLPLAAYLAFVPGAIPNTLTGLVTYPLVSVVDPLSLLINGLMLYQFGGSLERCWNMRTYLLFLIGSSVAAAIVWQFGQFLFYGTLEAMATPWLLIASVIVAWVWLNPEQTVLFMFFIPMKAKWIGWITIASLYLLFPPHIGAMQLITGFFALGGVAFAYAFVRYQRAWGWIPRRPRTRGKRTASRPLRHPASGPFGALLHPYREWQRKRRVAKLQRTFRLDDMDKR